MEQMRLELTSERMSGHGVVLSSDIFHAMILMRSYGALISLWQINIILIKQPLMFESNDSFIKYPSILLIFTSNEV